jgi:uncharacterized membrane protein YbaN (DUF454 family)
MNWTLILGIITAVLSIIGIFFPNLKGLFDLITGLF